MGSLSSRPSVPSQPQVVYYTPAPSYAPPASNPSTPSNIPSGEDPETPGEARTQSLLQRNRGIFGTVQTSFRGLLDLANNVTGRKTLLGE
jgi:hypothetical protein